MPLPPLSNHGSKSVSIPNAGGFLNGAGDVVVGIGQFVGQSFNLVRGSSDIIVEDSVASGTCHALLGHSRYKEELVDISVCDTGVNDCTWNWVPVGRGVSSKDPCVHSLVDINEHELDSTACSSDGVLDLLDLWLDDSHDLAFSNSIPVEDDLSGIDSIGSLESFKSLAHSSL